MTIKDKARKVVGKVDEVIAIADSVSDRLPNKLKHHSITNKEIIWPAQ